MVGIAQLVERLIVVQEVAGSKPVTHPKRKAPQKCGAFLMFEGTITRSRLLTRTGRCRSR